MSIEQAEVVTSGRPVRPLKVGIVGVGTVSTMALKSIPHLAQIELAAIADIDPGVRERVGTGFSVRAYHSVEDLCRDAEVEVIWATIVHDAYGYFQAHELAAWESGRQRSTPEDSARARALLRPARW